MTKKNIAIYARVSTKEQTPAAQLHELRRYAEARGFEIFREYIDTGSGSSYNRKALSQLMDDAKKKRFDLVIVFRFDRFARSTRHLLNSLEVFKDLGIGFISYSENIDLSSSLGTAMFTVIAAMAQLERDIIVERVKSGIAAAKARGIQWGKRPSIDKEKVMELRSKGLSFRKIAQALGISLGAAHLAVISSSKG